MLAPSSSAAALPPSPLRLLVLLSVVVAVVVGREDDEPPPTDVLAETDVLEEEADPSPEDDELFPLVAPGELEVEFD